MTQATSGRRLEWNGWFGLLVALVPFALILFWPTAPSPAEDAAAALSPDARRLTTVTKESTEKVRPSGALSPVARRLAAVTTLMTVLWITQSIPIGATSLIPIVAFPLLGIQSSKTVAGAYMDQNILLYLGGFVVALGIERWGLHRRMALCVMSVIGGTPRRAVLGTMLATAGISMWISNTATTLLMLPIALALLDTLRVAADDVAATGGDPAGQAAALDAPFRRLGAAMMLGVAYASSIGGFTTIVGTPTNIAFVKVWEDSFPSGPSIGAGAWMTFGVPIGAVLLIGTWGLLVARLPRIPGAERFHGRYFVERLRALGRPSQAELCMLAVFLATAWLWITREDLKFGETTLVPGWSGYVARWLAPWGVKAEHLHDSTVAILMALVMFALPGNVSAEGRPTRLMDWPTAARLPWDVLLLFGGGFAVASAFIETGFSDWLGQQFATGFRGRSPWVLVLGSCLLLTFLSEFTSNVATVTAILPVLASAAVAMRIDPRLIMIPAAIATSASFMLPIGTPPNAIVFATGRVRMRDMILYGLALNLLGAAIITVATFALIVPQMEIDLTKMPEWALDR